MRWLGGLFAIAALVAVTGGCGETIPVPDQGVIVTGCQTPAACYRSTCSCKRAEIGILGLCVENPTCANELDRTTCICPPVIELDGGATATTQCLETAQACVGQGVFCGGVGAKCVEAMSTCQQSGGAPPMMVPGTGLGTLEPHCQFADDVCCPGVDGGVATD